MPGKIVMQLVSATPEQAAEVYNRTAGAVTTGDPEIEVIVQQLLVGLGPSLRAVREA